MQTTIREAGGDDIPALARLAAEFFGDETWLRRNIEDTWPKWLVFVAEEDGELVGLAAAERNADLSGSPVFHLLHLYLSPLVRGRGVARNLVERIAAAGQVVWTMVPATEAHKRMARMFGFTESGVVMTR